MTEEQTAVAEQALERAEMGGSTRNNAIVITEFIERGVPAEEIRPRHNVLTYHAWRAKGRQVKKGERGVKVHTYIPYDKKVKDKETGKEEVKTYSKPRAATVFHISQTKEL